MAERNIYRDTIQPPTLAEVAQARPYRPKVTSSDFAACKLATLEALRQAGPLGLTTQELRDRGAGERPPNRICDLRKDGHLIKTVPGRPFRFVLLREVNGEKPPASPRPLKSWEQVCAERDEKLRQPEPEFELTP